MPFNHSTTAIGRAVLEAREGKRATAYRDSKGVWTIGVGHTAAAGAPAPFSGLTLSDISIDALFAKDLMKYEATVNASLKVPATPNQFDAFVSICYNIGQAGECNSTFIKLFNTGDIAGCAVAISNWEKDKILVPRREAEREQFLTPYAKSLPSRIKGEPPIKALEPLAASPAAKIASPSPVTVKTVAPLAAAHKLGLWAGIRALFSRTES